MPLTVVELFTGNSAPRGFPIASYRCPKMVSGMSLRQVATKLPSPSKTTAGKVCWFAVSVLTRNSGPCGAPAAS